MALKRYRFKTRFYVTKIPVQRLDGWYFFATFFGKNGPKSEKKTGQISFFVFLGPKMSVVTGIFLGFRHGGKLREGEGRKHGLEDADLVLFYAGVRHFYSPAKKCFCRRQNREGQT